MKQKGFILILLAVLSLSALLAGTVAAQDVDVSTMSNEELMVLLKSIMQKLEQDTAADTEEQEPETAETPVPTSAPTALPAAETAPEPVKHSIYENKKLSREPLPDSWFIKIEKGGGGDDKEHKKDKKNHGGYGSNIFF